MKKIFQKSMLLLCALIVGSSSVWAGDTFVKVTSTDDLVSGDVYIIATSSAIATAYSSGSLTTTSSGFTESSGTITTSTAKPMEFTLGKEGNNYTLKMSDDKYLGYYGSGNNFRNNQTSRKYTNEQWTIEYNSTYSLYTIVNVQTTTRFIGSGYEVFKVYAEMANNAPATLYKKLVGDDSEVTFVDKTPSIDYPGTTTYSQMPTTATGYMDETGAAISYEITANTAGATINASSGLVTVAHGGTVTVKATAAAIEGKFKSSNDSYTLTVNDNRAEAPISFSSSTAEATMGEDFVAPTLNNDEGLSVSYSSDNEAVATVNDATGLVTLVAPGTTNIIATFAGNATYKNTAVQYTLTVNKGAQTLPYEESFINSFGEFTSDGVNYDNISIWNATSESIRATSDIGNVNRNAESWLTSPVIDATNVTHIALSFQQAINKYFGTIANEAMVYAKNVGDADWTKLAITYPKKPSSGYSDFLTTTVDLSDFAGKKLQIAFVYKGATTAAGTWKVKNLKISVSAEDITISAAGLATYVSDYDLDFTNVENLEAYYATQSGSTVELHQVNKIAAGTGVLLRAKNNATNFEVPVTTAAADATTGNIFVRGTGAAVETTVDGKYNWILSKKSGVVGFYHANGNTVAKNRAYLQTTVASARIDLNFEDVTAIDEVRDEM